MSNDISVKEAGGGGAGGPAPEPLTLALDTATEARSVALVRGDRVLASRGRTRREAGASTVLLDVDETLRAAGVRLDEVELFAAAVGPGSFTGIRAGLATLKALATVTGRPAVGVPTLEALAHAARPAGRVFALLPAGRGELFAQLLEVQAGGAVRQLGPPEHVAPATLLGRAAALGGGLKWVCGCAPEFAAEVMRAAGEAGLGARAAAGEGAGGEAGPGEWVVFETCGGLAVAVASLARARAGAAGASETLRPLYVRPSDAELKDECRAPSL